LNRMISTLMEKTVTQIHDLQFTARPPVIDQLLYPGTYLFVGPPKLGKSFLMMQIGYHAAAGADMWGYETHAGTVLYLALEDDYRRLQSRLNRMFGEEDNDHFHLAIQAENMDGGLMEQIRGFVKDHPDTHLVIVDTLQKVRSEEDDKYSYTQDYNLITKFKEFTDETGVCLLAVHHTRKQQSDDKFEQISGTNALFGAADGAFILSKKKRTDDSAELAISCRDQPDQTLTLTRNINTLRWELEKAEKEVWKPPKDEIIEEVVNFMRDKQSWNGSASELVEALGVSLTPRVMATKLNVNTSYLLNEHQLRYDNRHTKDGSNITIEHIADPPGGDAAETDLRHLTEAGIARAEGNGDEGDAKIRIPGICEKASLASPWDEKQDESRIDEVTQTENLASPEGERR